MINPRSFFNEIKKLKIDFFTGVPDSLLKNFCFYISDNVNEDRHIISANEGNSIGMACGHYISSGKPALVYMQNSGFGNSINPITSLADKEVYGIPMLILVGWRGEPGVSDEPQHIKQGRVSEDLLKVLELPYSILGPDSDYKRILKDAYIQATENSCPAVILVQKGTFSEYLPNFSKASEFEHQLTRENAIKMIIGQAKEKDIFISTTGVASRELFEIREHLNQEHDKDFLTVGGMGHTNSIAFGIAISNKDQRVICLDGDGSALMHMGSIAILGDQRISNMIYILLNNGVHDSVGGQPTVATNINFSKIASACGFSYIKEATSQKELVYELNEINNLKTKETVFLEIKLKKGFRKSLGRPTQTPKENMKLLMTNIKKNRNR